MSIETLEKTFVEIEPSYDKENYIAKMKFCILQSSKSMDSRNRLLLFALEK